MRIEDLTRLVDDRVDEGQFNDHRDIFRDPEVFEMEMRHLFEGTWIGRQPVVLMRDARGNPRYHICQYHGWVYDSSGKNADIKDRKADCYSLSLDGRPILDHEKPVPETLRA